MAAPSPKYSKRVLSVDEAEARIEGENTFTVVEEQVIGTVNIGIGNGGLSPVEAAFKLVGERVNDGSEGTTFRFSVFGLSYKIDVSVTH